jgi:hypothetical protein
MSGPSPPPPINPSQDVVHLYQFGLGRTLHLDAAPGIPGDWYIELISFIKKPNKLML